MGPLLAIVLSNIYPIPACLTAHAVPAFVLDVALSEVAEDSIDAPLLSAAVVDALYLLSWCSCLVQAMDQL